MPPSLRSETIVVKHNNRTNVNLVSQAKKSTNKTKKKNTPRRNRAIEDAAPPNVVTVQPERLRTSFSQVMPLRNHTTIIFVGRGLDCFALHTNILPRSTLQWMLEVRLGARLNPLPDRDPEAFKIYRNYLYTNKISTISDEADDHLNEDANATWEWTRLAHCYIIGKDVRDEKFANTCIDAIIEKINDEDWYPTGIASEVYPNTREGDKLRKLIVDCHVRKGEGQWMKEPHVDVDGPGEFLLDVIDGMAPGIDVDGPEELLLHVIDKLAAHEADIVDEENVQMPWEVDKCAYHSHELTPRCT